MQARFVLGPSGSGKTFRCLAEVREALVAASEGPPLIFLAPKQATFQLERQLLADPALAGYTRLQILSFERLAEYLLTEFSAAPPQLLSEEGRLMVLRALLSQKRGELKLFHATARLRGFAQQLSGVLRELQQARITPERLLALAEEAGPANRLDAKLRDLALMLRAYLDWLEQHQLQDYDRLLALAADVLRAGTGGAEVKGQRSVISNQRSVISGQSSVANGFDARSTDDRLLMTDEALSKLRSSRGNEAQPSAKLEPPHVGSYSFERSADHSIHFAGLWLDGFAELSPQEMDLLAGLLPFCERATLALNLERESIGQTSWLSTWSIPSQTYRQLRQRLETNPAIETSEAWLELETRSRRFAGNPVLQHLEKHWSAPNSFPGQTDTNGLADALCVKVCPNPEAEALAAAREIRRFVRTGGRFRDVAVIVRNLDRYHDPVRRVFSSYDIPFFLDRREPVGHHPLAELTRSTLKTVAFQWPAEDWFAALKTGLVHPNEDEIDRLENEALARGWKGKDWQQPLAAPNAPELEGWIEPLREKLVRPFQRFAAAIGTRTSGPQMAEALRTLWHELRVEQQLAQWSDHSGNPMHSAFWEQMQDWLDNLALAFANEALPVREWLAVIDAGLSTQTVGVIPPTLDQVLVGAVDRSRNSELRLAVVLGVNESVFPALPPSPALLTEADRERLAGLNAPLGRSVRDHLGLERYLGYIACTRASGRLVLTCALRDEDDATLNPSPFIAHLKRLFPALEIETAPALCALTDAEHFNDLPARRRKQLQLAQQPGGASESGGQNAWPPLDELLTPAMAEQLYGATLQSSVSRLEEFAACPFRFFVRSGLRVEERKRFELDAREQGSFQHEVLARFHQSLRDEGKRWRDLTPSEGRERIAQIGEKLMPHFQNGLLIADDQSHFTARSMTAALQDFIETLLAWMAQYQFDPAAVELGFGQEGDPMPAWKLDLGDGHQLWFRGKIDRVDLCPEPDGRTALGVVLDYKSSAKKLDPVLMAHGIQMQLPAYLNVLRGLPEAARHFGLERIVPAGVFYVNLRGGYAGATSRRRALASVADARKQAYQHTGRFDAGVRSKLDQRGATKGDQFIYAVNKDGELSKRSREAMDAAAFNEMLDGVEVQLVRMGRNIFRGVATVDPYRKGAVTACDTCSYQGICRIDPWTHTYRVLRGMGTGRNS